MRETSLTDGSLHPRDGFLPLPLFQAHGTNVGDQPLTSPTTAVIFELGGGSRGGEEQNGIPPRHFRRYFPRCGARARARGEERKGGKGG